MGKTQLCSLQTASGVQLLSLVPLALGGAARRALDDALRAGAAGCALRTRPEEAGFCPDPATLETDAAWNSAFAVEAQALQDIGGVDARMGPAMAADLCRRLRLAGKKVVYTAGACVEALESPALPYAERLQGSLLLRCKFGAAQDVRAGLGLYARALLHPAAYGTRRGTALRSFWRALPAALSLLCARGGKNKALRNTCRVWYGADFGLRRGVWSDDPQPADRPLVSLIVRTRNRPETLRCTLASLRQQTYAPLEIVVVEDGEPLCREMLQQDFADLPLRYTATVRNIGRAAAFNLGVSLAHGELLNMLDDDDFLLPEHIEMGVARQRHTGADLVFLQGLADRIEVQSRAPYVFAVRDRMPLDFPRIEPFTMVRRCLTAEQGVLFRKELCESVGGMRAELRAHEDWNLWLRLMARGRWETLPYVDNVCTVPYGESEEAARVEEYAQYDEALLADDRLTFATDEPTLERYYESVIHDSCYLRSLGRLDAALEQELAAAREFLRDKTSPATFAALRGTGSHTLTGTQLRELYCTLMLHLAQLREEGRLEAFLSAELRRIG